VSAARARRDAPAEDATTRILREEQEMLKSITARSALKSVKELATVSASGKTRWMDG
jgi:hypothetical protein